MKNTHRGVLLLVACNFTGINILHGCFSRFLNFTNGTKSSNASHFSCARKDSKKDSFMNYELFISGEAAVHRSLQNRYSRKFRKFLMKRSLPRSLFNKVAGLHSATLLRRNSDTGVFLWNIYYTSGRQFLRWTKILLKIPPDYACNKNIFS